jgi:hypothetical protein
MAVIGAVDSSLEKRNPTVRLELDDEQTKAFAKYKPGQTVKLVLVGKLESFTQRKPYDPEQKGTEGDCCIEIKQMAVERYQKNQFEELMEGDDD